MIIGENTAAKPASLQTNKPIKKCAVHLSLASSKNSSINLIRLFFFFFVFSSKPLFDVLL